VFIRWQQIVYTWIVFRAPENFGKVNEGYGGPTRAGGSANIPTGPISDAYFFPCRS